MVAVYSAKIDIQDMIYGPGRLKVTITLINA